MSRTSALSVLLLLSVAAVSVGQQIATTESGQQVILYDDGTWDYADSADGGSAAVEAQLSRFAFVESSAANNWANDYQDFFEIRMGFANTTDRGIRAFRAQVVFRDLFGEVIWRVNIRQNDPIPPSSQTEWSGRVTYQMFDQSHTMMKGMRATDMTIELQDLEIIWSD